MDRSRRGLYTVPLDEEPPPELESVDGPDVVLLECLRLIALFKVAAGS